MKTMETINNFEHLFCCILKDRTSKQASYLSLPSSASFTGCIKEILYCLSKELKGEIKSDHSSILIANFYSWLGSDILIKEYDFLFYSQLLQTLKSYTEGQKFSKTEKYAFFEYINKSKEYKYRRKLYDKLIAFHNEGRCDEKAWTVIDCFISELLALGVSYSFLRFIEECYSTGKFESFINMTDYLFFGNYDSFDIYIPIEGFEVAKDNELFQIKKQKIEELNGRYYCKVYDNKTLDFHFIIKENIIRIDSLFNILRFYNDSKIYFARSAPIIVKSAFLKDTFQISFADVLSYRAKNYGKKYLKSSVEALEKIKGLDKESYHRILNVISYAEKDNDAINSSSYVDNWISLETLTSMSERKAGYESVNDLVPKMVGAKVFWDNLRCQYYLINNHLRKIGKAFANMEDFIKAVNQKSPLFDTIEDAYLRLIVIKLQKMFSSVVTFKNKLESIENDLRIDLLRIYILRNEYVHTSNIQAFVSMQPYKLKHILFASIDEFFKILSNRVTKDASEYGVVFDVFSEINNKYDTRNAAFSSLLENKKLLNGNVSLGTTLEEQKISFETFVVNVLNCNTSLFRKYDTD